MDQLVGGCAAIVRSVFEFYFACLGDDIVLAAVLVSVSVPANNDWLGPSGNKSGDIADDNGFSEDCAVENVPDSSVGGLPHLLQFKFLDTVFIRSDGCALNADFVFKHCV